MRIPTGISGIDTLLEGGIPTGCITELVGEPSTGKSYLALRTIAAAQAQGKTCLLIDTECSYDARWAQHLGVDASSLMVVQPSLFEQAEAMISEALTGHLCDLLVIDSLDALAARLAGTPLFQTGDPYHSTRILARFIPQLHSYVEIANAACIITSQYRQMGENFKSLGNHLMREHADIRVLLTGEYPQFAFTLKRFHSAPVSDTITATFRIN